MGIVFRSLELKLPNFQLKMVMQEVPSHGDYEEKSDTREQAEEDNVEDAVRDLSEQVDQLHSQLVDLEEEYGRIYEQLQDLVESNRDFTQALKEELQRSESESNHDDKDDNDDETKPDNNVTVA